MQTVTIGKNQSGQRLDKFLNKLLPLAGSNFLYKMLRKKNITLNEKKASGAELLKDGDIVSLFFSDETFSKFQGLDDKLDISEYTQAFQKLVGIKVIYEDDNILVLNKPAGILSQKSKVDDLSINEWMIGYLINQNPNYKYELATFKPSVCNRLDRNTSGLILCGKSLIGLQYLSKAIHDRSIRKYYRTICIGTLKDYAAIEGYLCKDSNKNIVTVISTKNTEDADFIQTAYNPIKTRNNYTLLEVELITGKPHQIRAHLAGIGHALIGDTKYGNFKINKQMQERYQLHYQLLHAYRIEFPNNEDTQSLKISNLILTAKYPKQFQSILTKMEME